MVVKDIIGIDGYAISAGEHNEQPDHKMLGCIIDKGFEIRLKLSK